MIRVQLAAKKKKKKRRDIVDCDGLNPFSFKSSVRTFFDFKRLQGLNVTLITESHLQPEQPRRVFFRVGAFIVILRTDVQNQIERTY